MGKAKNSFEGRKRRPIDPAAPKRPDSGYIRFFKAVKEVTPYDP